MKQSPRWPQDGSRRGSARERTTVGERCTVVFSPTPFGVPALSAQGRLHGLENESARLKQIVADQAVNISILKEVARGKFQGRVGGERS